VLPPAAASLDEAHAAIEMWEHYSGKVLDATQRLAVEVMMAESVDGLWAAPTTGREMPRQNGKGDEIEVVELWGLVQRSEAILHTIHDAVLLASQTQQRMLAVLDHPDLRRKVKRKWQGTGQQMIEMRNEGCIWYRTRTGGGGRGVDFIARLVVDEAQHATDEQLAAVTPTLMAHPNPQLNALGTAGLGGVSEWWWRQRRRALSDDPGAFGYVGHTAQRPRLDDRGGVELPPVDVSDRSLWLASNPAAAAGRGGGMAYLEEQLLRLGEDKFAQEHLCVWASPPVAAARVAKIPADSWESTVAEPPVLAPGEVVVSFAVERDGEWASVAVAAGGLSAPYVELVDHQPGVGWLPARVLGLVQRWQPSAVGCNGAGPTAAAVGPVLAELRAAGVTMDVTQLTTSAYKAACGGFFSDVVEGRLRRRADQGPLDLAVGDATERPLGDAWAWDRRQATVPISPLEAVTVARALLPTEVPAAPSVPSVAGGDAAVEVEWLAEIEREELHALEALNGR
jgi:hypothetical protein